MSPYIYLQARDPHGAWLTHASIENHVSNHSRAFYCPSCGDVWARWVIASFPHCSVEFRPCATHGSGFYSSGYIFNSLVLLSPELKRREFLLAAENPAAFLRTFPLPQGVHNAAYY